MTRSISHEIRTPLNTAFMALELIIGTLHNPFPTSAEGVEPFRHELLEIADSIKEGCDISLSILNQLLTFEKLSAGMMQLENKLITVEELLESNMKLFKMQVSCYIVLSCVIACNYSRICRHNKWELYFA